MGAGLTEVTQLLQDRRFGLRVEKVAVARAEDGPGIEPVLPPVTDEALSDSARRTMGESEPRSHITSSA